MQQLRKARNKTQVAVARKLNIGQDTVSRYERQADLLLSTLQRYVEAVEASYPCWSSFRIASRSRSQALVNYSTIPGGAHEVTKRAC